MPDKSSDNYQRNGKSFTKVNQYYHNAKALENVLKEDRDAKAKSKVEKENLMKRKQKVASYSKLVKEIHWEKQGVEKRHSHGAKRHGVRGSDASNKSYDSKRKNRMVAVDRIKELK